MDLPITRIKCTYKLTNACKLGEKINNVVQFTEMQ
jgi:hypothetical protein